MIDERSSYAPDSPEESSETFSPTRGRLVPPSTAGGRVSARRCPSPRGTPVCHRSSSTAPAPGSAPVTNVISTSSGPSEPRSTRHPSSGLAPRSRIVRPVQLTVTDPPVPDQVRTTTGVEAGEDAGRDSARPRRLPGRRRGGIDAGRGAGRRRRGTSARRCRGPALGVTSATRRRRGAGVLVSSDVTSLGPEVATGRPPAVDTTRPASLTTNQTRPAPSPTTASQETSATTAPRFMRTTIPDRSGGSARTTTVGPWRRCCWSRTRRRSGTPYARARGPGAHGLHHGVRARIAPDPARRRAPTSCSSTSVSPTSTASRCCG